MNGLSNCYFYFIDLDEGDGRLHDVLTVAAIFVMVSQRVGKGDAFCVRGRRCLGSFVTEPTGYWVAYFLRWMILGLFIYLDKANQFNF